MASSLSTSSVNDPASLAESLSKEIRSRPEAKSPTSSLTSGSPTQRSLLQQLATCVSNIKASTPKKPRLTVFQNFRGEGTSMLSPAHSSDSSRGDMERSASLPASPAMTAGSYFSRHGKEIASSPPLPVDSNQRNSSIAGGSSRLQSACSLGPPTPRSSPAPPAGQNGAVAAPGRGAKAPPRKRLRVSKKPPTTTVQADPANFLATVQSLTGCPPSASRVAAPRPPGLSPTLPRENRGLSASNSQARGRSQHPLPLRNSVARDPDNHMQAVVHPVVRFETLCVSNDPAPAEPQPVPVSAVPQPVQQAPISLSNNLCNHTFGYDDDAYTMMFKHLIAGSEEVGLSPGLEDHCIFSKHPSDMSLDVKDLHSAQPDDLSNSPVSESSFCFNEGQFAENNRVDEMSSGPAAQSGESSWYPPTSNLYSPTANGQGALDKFDRHQFLRSDISGNDHQFPAAKKSDPDDLVNSWLSSSVGYDHNPYR